MLVFKDTITGLAAGVRLTSNDMLHKGDWFTVKSVEAIKKGQKWYQEDLKKAKMAKAGKSKASQTGKSSKEKGGTDTGV